MRKTGLPTIWIFVVLATLAATTARGQDQNAARDYFTDVALVDHRGQALRFYSDLLEGNSVVINAFFSSCDGVCPVLMNRLTAVQDHLGERLGKDVRMLSLTVDRVNDTPERLASYARELGVGPGWHLLTGEESNLDLVLQKLGLAVETRDEHSPILLMGNLETGLWMKVMGLAESREVFEALDAVLEDSGAD